MHNSYSYGDPSLKELDGVICGANLMTKWNCTRGDLYKLIVCDELPAYGYLRKLENDKTLVTLNHQISRADDIDDIERWHGKPAVCFDIWDVERIEKESDRFPCPPKPAPPNWGPPSTASQPSQWEQNSSPIVQQEQSSKQELAQAKQQIADLKEEVAKLKTTASENSNSQTLKATISRKESIADEWEGFLQNAVLLTCYVLRNPSSDSKGYTRIELDSILKKYDWHMSKRALDAFRKAMPDELKVINKSGGAPTQG